MMDRRFRRDSAQPTVFINPRLSSRLHQRAIINPQVDFKNFDRRHYPTVSVRTGYGEWAATYEEAVPDQLDIRVLENLRSVNWRMAKQCLDLACGTGRTARWLKAQGAATIDGIDLTPEMLEQARAKELHRSLFLGSVEETGISGTDYDLMVMCLVDEHLASLEPVYREAYRLGTSRAKFVVTGMPTHL